MARTINCPNTVTLTKGQENALRHIIATLASDRTAGTGHQIEYTIKIEGTEYGNVWVSVDQDIPTLGDGNMLRVLTKCDSWFISVGPRGGMTARIVPNYARDMKKLGKININLK